MDAFPNMELMHAFIRLYKLVGERFNSLSLDQLTPCVYCYTLPSYLWVAKVVNDVKIFICQAADNAIVHDRLDIKVINC